MDSKDEEMKTILRRAFEDGLIHTNRKQGMTDEEYEKQYEEDKALGIRAINTANHEELGRIVNAIANKMSRDTGMFNDLK